MKKRYLQTVFSLLVTFIFFILLFRNISFWQVLDLISQADLGIILLAATIVILVHFFISPFSWKLILDKFNCTLSWQEAVLVRVGSEPIVSVIPFKIGEISKVLYLKQKKNMSSENVIFSILIDYFLNIVVLLFLSLFSAALWFFQTRIFSLDIREFLFMYSLNLKKRLINSSKWGANFKGWRFLFKIFSDKKILLYSFLTRFFELVVIYLMLRAMFIEIPFFRIGVYFPLIILISSIPITFFGLGVREALIVFLFSQYSSQDRLLAFSLVYSFLGYILPMLFGLSLTSLFVRGIVSGKDNILN